MEEIISLIANLGFPIACTIAMFMLWNNERISHQEEMNKISESLNNNTMVMQRLLDKLESENK